MGMLFTSKNINVYVIVLKLLQCDKYIQGPDYRIQESFSERIYYVWICLEDIPRGVSDFCATSSYHYLGDHHCRSLPCIHPLSCPIAVSRLLPRAIGSDPLSQTKNETMKSIQKVFKLSARCRYMPHAYVPRRHVNGRNNPRVCVPRELAMRTYAANITK